MVPTTASSVVANGSVTNVGRRTCVCIGPLSMRSLAARPASHARSFSGSRWRLTRGRRGAPGAARARRAPSPSYTSPGGRRARRRRCAGPRRRAEARPSRARGSRHARKGTRVAPRERLRGRPHRRQDQTDLASSRRRAASGVEARAIGSSGTRVTTGGAWRASSRRAVRACSNTNESTNESLTLYI